ncbi:MAG: nucleotidyltransferase domain-containing protein [Candidatus Micrarchaeia archaeon]|jgi:predicted nucleotidyltransferase
MNKILKNKDPIFSLITSTVRVGILNYFLFINKEGNNIRGTARFLNENPAQIRREFINLEKAGIFSKKKIGNQTIYFINPSCNFMDDLRNILFKAGGYTAKIKDTLSNIEKIQSAFIYGSYAEGDFTNKSDIDLFILGSPNIEEVNRKIRDIEKIINKEINYTIMPIKEFNTKKNYGFLKNVLNKQKIILFGDCDGAF